MNDLIEQLPSRLYSAEQVRALDARLIEAGTEGFELMRRAAAAVWRALQEQWPAQRPLVILTGAGNNAGDGFLVAERVHAAGWPVRVMTVSDPQRLSGDAALAFEHAKAAGVAIDAWRPSSLAKETLLIDAMLGTGLRGEVKASYRAAIEWANASGLPIWAVDIPSGLNADTGAELGAAIRAKVTITFIGMKIGLLTGSGPDRVGRLIYDDLQADPTHVADMPYLAQRLSRRNLPRLAPRSKTAHKGAFGHVLIIGGDRGMGGAVMLSAESALRTGAGLVSTATRKEHVFPLLAFRPEVMAHTVDSAIQLVALMDKASVVVLGPGLGQEAWGRGLASVVLNSDLPQVWDADALNLLAEGRINRPLGRLILTPHPGEAARLLQCTVSEVQADRPAAAKALADQYHAVIVLKGAGTLIADVDGRLSLCDRGHPAMAGAGLGDVLSGVIGALLAQKMPPFEAACLGVWLHACAGETLGAGGRGFVAAEMGLVMRQLLEEVSPCLA